MQSEWMDEATSRQHNAFKYKLDTDLKSKRDRNRDAFENDTYKGIEEMFPTFGEIAVKRQRVALSSLRQMSVDTASKDIKKMVSILNSFQTSSQCELSLSQIMKSASLTDTKKNRILINALVADGRLIVEGRSRATRYRLANHDQASAAIGGDYHDETANVY